MPAHQSRTVPEKDQTWPGARAVSLVHRKRILTGAAVAGKALGGCLLLLAVSLASRPCMFVDGVGAVADTKMQSKRS